MLLYCCIWGVLYLVNRKCFGNVIRYIILSVILVIFLLHPSITISTLALFECKKLDESTRRMRMHMDFECYSFDHFKWIVFVGLPSIVIWIIGAPTLAFIILFKNRKKLEDWPVKKYFLILYKGLKPKVFYWEFVNTMRKVLILIVNTTLIALPISMRIIISVLLLMIIIRIQLRLDPHKISQNSSIEMKAIIAGMMTIYCGLLFSQEGEDRINDFNTMALIILIIINAMFLIEWFYLFLLSFNVKNDKFIFILHIYGSII